jgi:hypothetical protein
MPHGVKFRERVCQASCPQSTCPPTIIPDHYDDEHCDDDGGDNDMTLLTIGPQIQIRIKDFGGNFAMPHYGHLHPSADYFKSNLMVSNFVVADLTSNSNNVFFYDERLKARMLMPYVACDSPTIWRNSRRY